MVELPADDQLAYLQENCANNPDLIEEVLALVDNANVDDTGLQQAIQVSADRAVHGPDRIGKMLGPYRVMEKIDHGGMGTVYKAERSDKQFSQTVAIKILRSSLESNEARHRFLSERQILANLNHPYICQLVDGGTTEDDTPYLVMELVEGTPIDRFCDDNQLDTKHRLKLFAKVCDAVQFAHQNLVVHRDIKPNNILVTTDGNPKLLDFGIAKLLDEQQVMHTVAVTQEDARVLTPEYASPEQVRGEPISTATDVYSLGVLLYRLLSGHSPYGVTGKQPFELQKAILSLDPKKPSTMVATPFTTSNTETITPEEIGQQRHASPQRLRKILTGDLDNIVLMAMRKEPGRRYRSVQLFAQDIEHYLGNEPVLAHPPTLSYRSGKFIQRNRLAVFGGALSLGVIAGLVTYYTYQVTQERDKAQLEAQKAAQVSDFMLSLFDSSNPNNAQGNDISARSLLDAGAQRIQQDLESQPEVQAAMEHVMGNAYRGLALYEDAGRLIDSALATRKKLYPDGHADIVETLSIKGGLLQGQGRYEDMVPTLNEALTMNRRIHGEDHHQTASLLDRLGRAFTEQGKHDEAETAFAQALSIQQKVLEPRHVDIGATRHGMGRLALMKGEHARAEEQLAAAVDILTEHLGERDPRVQVALNELTFALMDQGKWDQAESVARRGLEISTAIFGQEHPDVSGAMISLATILETKGQLEEAETHYREAMAIDIKVFGTEHPYIALNKNNLAGVLRSQGKYIDAEALYRESLTMNQSLRGEEHQETATTQSNLGTVLAALGKFEEAEIHLQRSTEIRRQQLGADHPHTITSEYILANFLHSIQRLDDSNRLFEKVLAKRRELLGDTHPHTALTLIRYGALLERMGQLDQAQAVTQEGLAANRATFGENHTTTAQGIRILGRIAEEKDDLEQAEKHFQEALATYRKLHTDKSHPTTAIALSDMSQTLIKKGQAKKAVPMLEEALAIRQELLPEDHWQIGVAKNMLGHALVLSGTQNGRDLMKEGHGILVETRGEESWHTQEAKERMED